MDFIRLSDFSDGADGILRMLEHYMSDHDFQRLVSVEIALLIVEIAKRADDRPEWFTRGKWSMTQAIQDRIEVEIDKVMKGAI